MTAFWNNIRFGFRTLSRDPGFTIVALLILALGIGANTAIFSIIDGVLLKPLPFREPERLFAVQESVPKFGQFAPTVPVSAHHFQHWRKEWRAADQIAIIGDITLNLTSGGEPERLNGSKVSASLFPLLGVSTQLGRPFLEEEDHPGRDRVVILSDGLWRRRFHADPSILGSKIILDGVPCEVIGVMPPRLRIPKVSQLQSLDLRDVEAEIWKPMAIREQDLSPMGDFNYGGIVRLKEGVSAKQALDELNAVEAAIAGAFDEKIELRGVLSPLQAQIAGRSRQGLLLLFAAGAAVLLIVCVNIANLLLARATGRGREFAIRRAIGAGAGQLMRQMLAESVLLSTAGGALGLALAYWSLHLILASAPLDLPQINEITIDARVLAIAFAVSILCGILFGLLPAWRVSRGDPQDGLKAGSRTISEGRQGGRARSLLVSLEVALSTVCLIAAGLLLSSFARLMRVDKGFEVERIVTVSLSLPAARYPDRPQRAEFLRRAIDAVKSLPGVAAAGVSNLLPLTGEGNNNILTLEGRPTPLIERPIADFRCINPDFFRTMGIRLLRGRGFEEADRQRDVTVISAITAERLWPGEDGVGKRFRLGGDNARMLQVIGIAGDVRGSGLQKPPVLTVYIPYWQRDRPDMALVIRTSMDPRTIASAVRVEIRKLDRELPVPEFRTMQQIVSHSVAQRRFQLTLVLLFAGAALLLAGIGIYGVISYSVTQRRNEMGIRMALGAAAYDIRHMVLWQGLRPVFVGLAAGLLAAFVVGRIISSLLFGVAPADPVTFTSISAVLLAVSAAACYIPALRATRVDPMLALRYD